MARNAVTIGCSCLFALVFFSATALAQSEGPAEKGRDGVFEITLRGSDHKRRMTVDELVRDRDLLPGALYRVKIGGFLAFDEAEWVDKIEFKVNDQPVTEMPEYRRFATLLVDINTKISDMKQVLGQYDQLAMRMMNMCDRSRFPTLQSVDENVSGQLTVYRQLVLLRGMVINSLNRFIMERSCRDKYADYKKSLNLYGKHLDQLTQDYQRLNRKAMALSQDLKGPERRKQSGEREGEPEQGKKPEQEQQ